MAYTKPAKIRVDWRQRRGTATKNQILDATVRCIVKHGYGALTTTMIADAAQVSRGAMLHHFPSKEIIVHETIRYLFKRRMHAFEKMVEAIPRSGDLVHDSIEVFWKQVHHPYFIAFFELTVAARTDKALLETLAPCLQALDERGLDLAEALFPNVDRSRLALGMALSQGIIEHLALQHIQQKSDRNDKSLISYLEHQIRILYQLDGLQTGSAA
jgi:AcrR family transcriptional regulator